MSGDFVRCLRLPLPKWRARGTGTRHHGGGQLLSSARGAGSGRQPAAPRRWRDFYAPLIRLLAGSALPANKRGSLTAPPPSKALAGHQGRFLSMAPPTATSGHPLRKSHRPRWPGTLENTTMDNTWSGPTFRRIEGSGTPWTSTRPCSGCAGHPHPGRDHALCHAAPRRQRGGLSRPHGQIWFSPARRCRSLIYLSQFR